MSSQLACRLYGGQLAFTFAHLGRPPLRESYVPAERLDELETLYPLAVRLRTVLMPVQLPACLARDSIYPEFACFSPYSAPWAARRQVRALAMIDRIGLLLMNLIFEVTSNDGARGSSPMISSKAHKAVRDPLDRACSRSIIKLHETRLAALARRSRKARTDQVPEWSATRWRACMREQDWMMSPDVVPWRSSTKQVTRMRQPADPARRLPAECWCAVGYSACCGRRQGSRGTGGVTGREARVQQHHNCSPARW